MNCVLTQFAQVVSSFVARRLVQFLRKFWVIVCKTRNGCWNQATGHLNQINVLWSFPAEMKRQRFRDEL